jgi:ribonucleoside-diphosphate reductase subunit M2
MSVATPTSKAAHGLADLALVTPVKQDLVHKLKAANDASQQQQQPQEEEPIEDYRLRFVGDVDLDEKDEPLLKESQRRFVLFPIQYHEVSRLLSTL